MSTTSSASSNPGARASTWPSSSSTSEWPSKISSSWPPTALQKATKQALSRARVANISSRSRSRSDVERRGRDVGQQLRAGQREVGRRRPRLPHVLADGRADERAAELEQQQVARGREVAVLVEDAVVRQEALAVDGLHLAVGADRARVVEVAVEVGEADERDEAARLARDLLQRLLGRADEARPQQQVLGRVGRDGELGQEHEVGLGAAGLGDRLQDALAVAVEVADGGVDLGERESHQVLDYQSKTASAVGAGSRSGPARGSRRRGGSGPRCRRARRGCSGRRARPPGPRRARARAAARAPAASKARRPGSSARHLRLHQAGADEEDRDAARELVGERLPVAADGCLARRVGGAGAPGDRPRRCR